MEGTGEEIRTREVDAWDAREYLLKRVPQAQYNRRSFDRIFYRNCLFYLGLQWIRYNRSAQQWRPISVPDWFPKQITNKFATNCDMMKSVFMQTDPQSIFSPASAEFSDIAAARAAMDISKFIELEVQQSELESRAATWLVLTGNAFVINGYDKDDKHGTKFVSDMACLDCVRHIPAEAVGEGCPYCGGQHIIEAKDENGNPIGQTVPIGRLFSEIASPFEMHFDMTCGNIDQSPYIYRARTYPIDMIKDMFPDHADDIKPDDAGIDSGMFYQTALSYITNGTSSSPGNYAGSVGSIDNVPRCTLYHLYVRPSKKLPRGGEALTCGAAELWKSELSFHDEEDNPIVPITHMGFNTVPGRVLCKTPADDMVFKQTQRNKMEAFIQLAMERTSNPTWLLPKGIGLNNISGEPGEKIWYNAFNASKPERIGGAELPGAVFRWLDAIDKDMQDISHTYDVMKGETPKGFPTLGGAQLLLERGFAGFSDGLKSWGRGWNQVRHHRLMIWREYAADEKTMMVLGNNKEWEAKKFSKDSLAGRINVYLEEGSIAPKSKAYEQMIAGQMLQQNLLNMQDPMVQIKVMSLFDMGDMVEGLNSDVKDAAREKEDFLKTGQPRPRPVVDNDKIHLQEHVGVAKSDEYRNWPPLLQNGWIQHIMYHSQRLQQQQQQETANDPHMLNAKARLEQIMLEVQALAKSKDIELNHMQQRKAIDIQSHGVKKGMDMAIDAQKAQQRLTQPQALNGGMQG